MIDMNNISTSALVFVVRYLFGRIGSWIYNEINAALAFILALSGFSWLGTIVFSVFYPEALDWTPTLYQIFSFCMAVISRDWKTVKSLVI